MIWIRGSDGVGGGGGPFLRNSKLMCYWISERYYLIENVVPIDHNKTLKWLDWLGFAFGEEATIVNGYSCVRFVRCDEAIEVRFQ